MTLYHSLNYNVSVIPVAMVMGTKRVGITRYILYIKWYQWHIPWYWYYIMLYILLQPIMSKHSVLYCIQIMLFTCIICLKLVTLLSVICVQYHATAWGISNSVQLKRHALTCNAINTNFSLCMDVCVYTCIYRSWILGDFTIFVQHKCPQSKCRWRHWNNLLSFLIIQLQRGAVDFTTGTGHYKEFCGSVLHTVQQWAWLSQFQYLSASGFIFTAIYIHIQWSLLLCGAR